LGVDDRARLFLAVGPFGHGKKSGAPLLKLGLGACADRVIRQDLRSSRKILGPKLLRATRRCRSFSATIMARNGTTALSRWLRRLDTDSLSCNSSPASASWETTVSMLWLTNAMASGSSASTVRILTGSVGIGTPDLACLRRFMKCP